MAEKPDQVETRPSKEPEAVSYKLFLGGLSWETNEEILHSYFSKYGEICSVAVMRAKQTGNPRGFGFVTFKTEEAAKAACSESHNIDGRTIDAKPSLPRSLGQNIELKNNKIFVGGLSSETKEDHLKSYFEQFGSVCEAQVMLDPQNGRSRGFGFVTFEDEQSVEEVLKTGHMHELNSKKVEVKLATPKGYTPQPRKVAEVGTQLHANRPQYMSRVQAAIQPYPEYRQNRFPQPVGYSMPGYGVPMSPQYGPPNIGPYAAYSPMMIGYGSYNPYNSYQQGNFHPTQSGSQGYSQHPNAAVYPATGRRNSRRPAEPQYGRQQQPRDQSRQ